MISDLEFDLTKHNWKSNESQQKDSVLEEIQQANNTKERERTKFNFFHSWVDKDSDTSNNHDLDIN